MLSDTFISLLCRQLFYFTFWSYDLIFHVLKQFSPSPGTKAFESFDFLKIPNSLKTEGVSDIITIPLHT